ncbi:ATP-binding protein [Protofrankia symbiont of Coriaria ruscifolia]|uniref:Histidine kinase/HSP90-like ATPase domain-containing protein n=1 Tax=Candidatus Protofrankia californiensis TaxID=1839754 RepID=A0A1C3PGM5_9ACTN|nr:hypothetical protein FDG2_6284 [Candidatus Protofrankia californiensis]
MSTVELRFAALPGHVRTARMIAAAVSRRSGVPEGILDEIKLAVGEACARAVSVNRRFDPQAPVIVRVSDNDGSFTVSVADRGPQGRNVSSANGSSANGCGQVDAPEPLDTSYTRPATFGSRPVVAAPVVAQPIVAQPVVTDPAVADPADSQPAVAEPVITNPVASRRDIRRPDEEDLCSTAAPGLGLALIEGLVDDFTITTRTDSSGMIVTMRWPVDRKTTTPIMAL